MRRVILLPRAPGNLCSELCSEWLRQRTKPWVTDEKEFSVYLFYFLFSSQHKLVTRCWGFRAKSDRAL